MKYSYTLSSVVDPWHFGTDPDSTPNPDPALLVSGFQDAKKKSFIAHYFLTEHLHHSSKIKSHK
jgi:hypothetical protein